VTVDYCALYKYSHLVTYITLHFALVVVSSCQQKPFGVLYITLFHQKLVDNKKMREKTLK